MASISAAFFSILIVYLKDAHQLHVTTKLAEFIALFANFDVKVEPSSSPYVTLILEMRNVKYAMGIALRYVNHTLRYVKFAV